MSTLCPSNLDSRKMKEALDARFWCRMIWMVHRAHLNAWSSDWAARVQGMHFSSGQSNFDKITGASIQFMNHWTLVEDLEKLGLVVNLVWSYRLPLLSRVCGEDLFESESVRGSHVNRLQLQQHAHAPGALGGRDWRDSSLLRRWGNRNTDSDFCCFHGHILPSVPIVGWKPRKWKVFCRTWTSTKLFCVKWLWGSALAWWENRPRKH